MNYTKTLIHPLTTRCLPAGRGRAFQRYLECRIYAAAGPLGVALAMSWLGLATVQADTLYVGNFGYYGNGNGQIIEYTAGGAQSTIASGLSGPFRSEEHTS